MDSGRWVVAMDRGWGGWVGRGRWSGAGVGKGVGGWRGGPPGVDSFSAKSPEGQSRKRS